MVSRRQAYARAPRLCALEAALAHDWLLEAPHVKLHDPSAVSKIRGLHPRPLSPLSKAPRNAAAPDVQEQPLSMTSWLIVDSSVVNPRWDSGNHSRPSLLRLSLQTLQTLLSLSTTDTDPQQNVLYVRALPPQW